MLYPWGKEMLVCCCYCDALGKIGVNSQSQSTKQCGEETLAFLVIFIVDIASHKISISLV